MQLPAEADLEHSAALAASLPAAVQAAAGTLRIDASALKRFDSSTIALLLQARRLAQAAGQTFDVQGVPLQLLQLAQLYGVDELLPLSSPPSSASDQRAGSA